MIHAGGAVHCRLSRPQRRTRSPAQATRAPRPGSRGAVLGSSVNKVTMSPRLRYRESAVRDLRLRRQHEPRARMEFRKVRPRQDESSPRIQPGQTQTRRVAHRCNAGGNHARHAPHDPGSAERAPLSSTGQIAGNGPQWPVETGPWRSLHSHDEQKRRSCRRTRYRMSDRAHRSTLISAAPEPPSARRCCPPQRPCPPGRGPGSRR